MRLKQLAYSAAVVLAVAGLTFSLAPAVHAAEVATVGAMPPSALPGCVDPPAAGGWDDRDFTVAGTSGEDEEYPVRPLLTRLGEPCVVSGALKLVLSREAIPIDPIDADEDGYDDPLPPAAGLCEGNTAATIPTANEASAVTVACNEIRPTYLSGANIFTSTAESVSPVVAIPFDSNTMEIDWAFDFVTGTDARGFRVELFCKSSTGAVTTQTADAAYSTNWTTTPPTHPQQLSCTGGSTSTRVPWMVVADVRVHSDGTRKFGVLYNSGGITSPSDFNGSGYYAGTQAAEFKYGNLSPGWTGGSESVVVCGENTSNSGTTQTYTMAALHTLTGSPFGEGYVPGDPLLWNNTGYIDLEVLTEQCPYLVSVTLAFCAFTDYGADNYTCFTRQWTADRFRSNTAYPGGGMQEGLCDVYPDLAGCYEVLNPTIIDGTNFDQACAGAPEPAWLDFGWLPAFLGHYAECLWVPINGFDRLAWVSTAWNGSPMGELASLVSGAANSFAVSETCGVIVDATGTTVPLVIDTCSWTWAATAKPILTAGVLIIFGLFALQFIVATSTGIINRRIPDPMKGH